jgi:hypothetical protein
MSWIAAGLAVWIAPAVVLGIVLLWVVLRASKRAVADEQVHEEPTSEVPDVGKAPKQPADLGV